MLSDDLSLPPSSQAKVRIVNASLNAPLVDVSVQNGPTVATGVAFANSSQYGSVPAGSWTLSVTPKGGATTPTTGNVDLAAGSVSPVLLLDEAGGTVEVVTHTDASAAGAAAAGGVATGLGGTAGGSSSLPLTVLAIGAGVLLAGALGLRRMLVPGSWPLRRVPPDARLKIAPSSCSPPRCSLPRRRAVARAPTPEPRPPRQESPPPTISSTMIPVLRSAAPVSLTIPKLDLAVDLERLGLDGAGALIPPQDFARPGWYVDSAVPGDVAPL